MRLRNYRARYLLFLLSFGFLVSGRTQDGEKPYKIIEVYTDSTLSKDETKVEFIFTNNLDEQVNILVRLYCNGELNTVPRDSNGALHVVLRPETYSFKFQYRKRQEFEYISEGDLEIITDSISLEPAKQFIIQVNLGDVNETGQSTIFKKPQIYFYPETTTNVTVDLNFKGLLSFSYPAYDNGWAFTADPNGLLTMGNKQYNYMFWDGFMDVLPDQIKNNEGFVVNKNELITFLEEKLTALGLNTREQQDFITFWAPQMSSYNDVFVHFLVNEACDTYAEMNISPKPDNMLRIYMLWTHVNPNEKPITTDQVLPSNKRKGFTVVEWGGVEFSGFENSLINN
jgi:hypothetical protein